MPPRRANPRGPEPLLRHAWAELGLFSKRIERVAWIARRLPRAEQAWLLREVAHTFRLLHAFVYAPLSLASRPSVPRAIRALLDDQIRINREYLTKQRGGTTTDDPMLLRAIREAAEADEAAWREQP